MTNRALSFIWENVGHCMKCMITSLQTLILASIVTGLGIILNIPFWAIIGLSIATISLGILWLAHVIAFSLKLSSITGPSLDERRKILSLIGQSMAIAVAPAVLAIAPQVAWATSATDHKCYCCSSASPESCGCDTPASCAAYGKCTMTSGC
jgi:hypothetical protein